MWKSINYILALVVAAFLVFCIVDYLRFTKERDAFVYAQGEATTEQLRTAVNEILERIEKEAEKLAQNLGEKEYTEEEIKALIKESALSVNELQGVTVGYEPFAFNAKQRLYCPYYNKGDQSYIQVEDSYDYTQTGKGTAWYTSVRDGGAKWVEPYYARAAKDWYVDYGTPFYVNTGPNKGKVRGTITMSFICSGFKEVVHSLALGKTGYGMITSPKGTFLAHPVNEFVGTQSIDSVKENLSNSYLIAAYDSVAQGAQGHLEFFDSSQKSQTLFYYDQIPASGWSIGLLFYKNDLLQDQIQLNRKYIRLAIVISLLIVLILAIIYGRDYLSTNEIWQLSAISTTLLAANIILIAGLQHTTNTTVTKEKSPPITDLNTLGSFVNQHQQKARALKKPLATAIPTGIYVHRMAFEDSYNLNVSGKIWQKYPEETIDSVEVGFDFPQMSPFAEASYIEETQRRFIQGKEGEPSWWLVSSDFRVTLRLNFQYADYPLDKRHINIEIVPLDQNDHLILIPDLESYSYTNPSKKSGLNPNIRISGSELLTSYFNFSTESFDTDFGFPVKGLYEEVPTLHFNIHTRRLLLNAFVTYLIPIFVTMIITFILMIACTKTQERQGIIESMAAFFFVLIFSHIDLRKEIETADMMYMEYFYFLSYIMLVLSTFNLIVYTKDKSGIFDYKENLFAKSTFFPLFFLLVLALTLWRFY